MTLESQNPELLADLRQYSIAGDILNEIAGLVGATPADLSAGRVNVVAYWLEPSPELLTIWMITIGTFSVYQRTREGESLSVTVPIERISRVVTTGDGGANATVAVELDADQSSVLFDAAAGNGVVRRAGYSLAAGAERRDALLEFARRVRLLLSGGN